MTWMLYGAYGFTGKLTAELAVERGHKPLLAGRNEEKTAALAAELDLEYTAFPLEDKPALHAALQQVDAVVHAAGPFVYTAKPMLHACLAEGVHYLDITGEIGVFEHTFLHDKEAGEAGIALLSGVGFDVVPTDCLAVYVAEQIDDPTHLELGFANSTRSSGTAKTSVIGLAEGGALVRRNGHLEPIKMGSIARDIHFAEKGMRTGMAIPWGDLATAYRSTGIPNITTYMSTHPDTIATLRRYGGLARAALKLKPLRQLALNVVENSIQGPTEAERTEQKGYVWAYAENASGASAEAWLITPEAYHLTAESSLLAVERVLEGGISGALTPAQAFGKDFVLEIEGTTRLDSLEAV